MVDGLLVRVRAVVDSGDRQNECDDFIARQRGSPVRRQRSSVCVIPLSFSSGGGHQGVRRNLGHGLGSAPATLEQLHEQSQGTFWRHHWRPTISWPSSKPSMSGWYGIAPHARPQRPKCSRPPVARRIGPSPDARAGYWRLSSAVATSS
jgi:hypothetical protein